MVTVNNPTTDAAIELAADERWWRLAWHHLLILAAAATVLILAAVLQSPDQRRVTLPGNLALPDLCTFRRLTGYDCAGCGLTRCFVAMAHGQWLRAFSFNPIGVLWFGVMIFQFPYRTVQVWRLRRGQPELYHPAFSYVLLALAVGLVVQWLFRMAF